MYVNATLLATLGQEPQVVTLALDRLLAIGEHINRVVVIYSDPNYSPVANSLTALQQEFKTYLTYCNSGILLDPFLLTANRQPLTDIISDEQIDAAVDALYQLISFHKRTGNRLHLSIAGGRKTLGLFAFSMAQLLFDPDDHIWHLVSDEALRQSRHLHAFSGDEVSMIDIPFMGWSSLPGAVRSNQLGRNAKDALSRQVEIQEEQRRRQARTFIQSLTQTERDLLHLLIDTAATNKELAQQMQKSEKTIANQFASIYRKFADFYQLVDRRIVRAQVIAVLGKFI